MHLRVPAGVSLPKLPLKVVWPAAFLFLHFRSRYHKRQCSQEPPSSPGGASPVACYGKSELVIPAGALDFSEVPAAKDGNALQPEPLFAPAQLPTVLVDEVLNIGVQALFRVLFEPEAEFVERLYAARRYRDVSVGPWTLSAEGQAVRQISYVTPVKKNKLGPTEALCVESYQVVARQAAGFAVSLIATTPQVPFGGNFHQALLYIGTAVSPTQSRLQVSCSVNITKSIWVPNVNNLVRSSSMEGMHETYQTYITLLREHIQRQHGGPGGPYAGPGGQDSMAPKQAVRASTVQVSSSDKISNSVQQFVSVVLMVAASLLLSVVLVYQIAAASAVPGAPTSVRVQLTQALRHMLRRTFLLSA